jgi:L-lactate dehydrogenase
VPNISFEKDAHSAAPHSYLSSWSFGEQRKMKDMTSIHRRKVVVVGAGAVGSTYSYALVQSGLADEIALIDQNTTLTRGQVLDLAHGQPFFPTVSIREGDTSDYRDAQLIVITAGAAQRPGETRLDLLQRNATIMRSIVSDIVERGSRAVMLVVSNPVDVMTHVAVQGAGVDRGRVLGSGTVLDSARLRHLLSAHCGVDVHNVHAYVLGEHGDSEFAAWSMTHVGGMLIDEFCPICGRCDDWKAKRDEIEQQVRDSAYHIIGYKGATCFAVGLALVRVTSAILRGESSVLTVSTRLEGEFGLRDVCLSVPCIVSERGVERVIASDLPENEVAALSASAGVVKKAIAQLGNHA